MAGFHWLAVTWDSELGEYTGRCQSCFDAWPITRAKSAARRANPDLRLTELDARRAKYAANAESFRIARQGDNDARTRKRLGEQLRWDTDPEWRKRKIEQAGKRYAARRVSRGLPYTGKYGCDPSREEPTHPERKTSNVARRRMETRARKTAA
jgi:hypothetical protein